MWPLLGSVFLASLAGSGHCAGMCGAISIACSGCDRRRDGATSARGGGTTRAGAAWREALAYHLARGAAYLLGGAIVGGIGATLDLGGRWIGVQRAAAIIAGASVALVGVATLFRLGGFQGRAAMPAPLQRALGTAHRWAARTNPLTRSITLGALSVLLPCGWLWAFLAVAAGAGSPFSGAAVMAAFWAGTVPVMVLIGGGAWRLGALWRGRVAAVTALMMIAVGIHTVATANERSRRLDRFELRPASDLVGASLRLDDAQNEVPPCCRNEEISVPLDGAALQPGGAETQSRTPDTDSTP